MQINNKVIAGVAGGVILLALIIGIFGVKAHVGNVALLKEKQIVELNNNNTIQLNQYVASLKEQVGIANVKSNALDKVLKDALSARYNPTQMADPKSKGSFYSAMHEAYPNIDLSLYDKILTFVQGQRQDYALLQKQLQSMLADFDTWRGSFPNSMFTGNLPDHWLVATDDNGNKLEGQKALDYLETISQPNGSNNGGGQTGVDIPGLNGK
ncbi:MAG: hypothetical protein U0103_24555 [Candidatus Obscuribacterales bacterium]|nr:MAG: hypothetical protein EKK48_08935 [Candidatus Melainabacteria bacterium]